MKRLTVALALFVAAVGFGAAYSGTNFVFNSKLPGYLNGGGIFIGSNATADTANRVTTVKRCTLVYDFPPVGGTMSALDTYCAESSAATCTGVVFGDQLAFGVDQVLPGSGNLNAYVSAASAVKVRSCASGITDAGAFDMPDASYTFTWIH